MFSGCSYGSVSRRIGDDVLCGPNCKCNHEACRNNKFDLRKQGVLEVDVGGIKGSAVYAGQDFSPDDFVCTYTEECKFFASGLFYKRCDLVSVAVLPGFEYINRRDIIASQGKMSYFIDLGVKKSVPVNVADKGQVNPEVGVERHAKKSASTAVLFLDASRKGNIGRLLNHSHDPNCELFTVRFPLSFRVRSFHNLEETIFELLYRPRSLTYLLFRHGGVMKARFLSEFSP
jgi:hypothetical protein